MNEYRNYQYKTAQNNQRNRPVVPLPPEGEMPIPPIGNEPVIPLPPIGGMPIPPIGNEPVIPLPPIGGMPIPPIGNEPVIPLPPIGGMPIPPIGNEPVIPLPPIGGVPVIPLPPEPGKPVYPGGGAIIVPVGFAQVRFLMVAVNYGPVNISIGSREYANNLAFGGVSSYGRVNDGFRTVTVTSAKSPKGVLFKKSIPFVAGTKVTMALVNAPSGLEIVQISDEGCTNRQKNMGCFRVANLSYNSAPIDILQSNGRVVFSDVRFKEVTAFKQAKPGNYQFYVAETPRRFRSASADIEILEPINGESEGRMSGFNEEDYLLSFYLRINPNIMYTAYIIGNDGFTPGLQVLIVENN